MSAINGTLYAVFSKDTGAIASTDKIYACKTASLKVDVNLDDVSTKESGGWWEGIPGQKNWSIDFGGVWDEAGSATALTVSEIMALILAGNVVRKVAFVPAALGTSIPGWSGQGFFQNMNIQADLEVGCTFSGAVKGTAALALFTS
jgi:predicted secreted protein